MKKLFIFMNILSIFTILIGLNLFASTESVAYQYEINDNYWYNLETGIYEPNTDYYVTNRIDITKGLDLSGGDFHHILAFSQWNNFLGYFNRLNSNVETDFYLGLIDDDLIFNLPEGTSKVAFLSAKQGGGFSAIDTPIPELNNNTLRSVFENKSIFTQFGSYGTWVKTTPNMTSLTVTADTDSYFDITAFAKSEVGMFVELDNYYDLDGFGENQYFSVDIELVYRGSYRNPFTRVRSQLYYGNGKAINGLIDIEPTILDTGDTFFKSIINNDNPVEDLEGGTEYKKIYLVFDRYYYSTTYEYQIRFNKTGTVFINLDEYGLESVSTSTMDFYLNEYIEAVGGSTPPYTSYYVLSDFDGVIPSYTREALETAPDDVEGWLEAMLDNMGFNDTEGKLLLAIAIIVITIVALAIVKASFSIIVFVAVGLFVGLSFIGWLPIWVNIIIALGLVTLIILKVKSGGGSSEE